MTDEPPPPQVAIRFAAAQSITGAYGIQLADWIACDDQMFRSSRLVVDPDGEWWSVG